MNPRESGIFRATQDTVTLPQELIHIGINNPVVASPVASREWNPE
jgi:hypothetical protein